MDRDEVWLRRHSASVAVVVAWALGILLTMRPGAAAAQSAPSSELGYAATEHFDRGVALYEAGEHAAALAEFRASYGLVASPNSRLLAARTLRAMGRLGEALAEYQLAVREAEDRMAHDARFARTREAAQAEHDALEPLVAWLVLTVPPDVAGGTITVGDRRIPIAGASELVVPIDPGTFSVRAESPGRRSEHVEGTIAAGERRGVHLTLELEATLVAPRPSPASGADGSWTEATSVAGWILAGAGVVTLAAALGTFLAADARYGELAARCGAGPCSPPEPSVIAEGRQLDAAALACTVAGSVALTAGVALIVAAVAGEPGASLDVGEASVSLDTDRLQVRF